MLPLFQICSFNISHRLFLVTMNVSNPWNSAFSNGKAYAETRPQYEEQAILAIFDFYGSGRPKIAVDLACGSGQITRFLASRCDRVIGLDFSFEQIETGRQLIRLPNVEFHQCSVFEAHKTLEKIHAEKVDLITVATSSHYFHEPKFYSEMRLCLRRGGVLAEVCYWIRGLENCAPNVSDRCVQFITSLFKECQAGYGVELYIRKYQDFDVRMDNVQRLDMIFREEWAYSRLALYFICSTPRTYERKDEIENFFKDLEKEDGKQNVTVTFDIFGYLSQNLQDD